jgi:hypothetical protein
LNDADVHAVRQQSAGAFVPQVMPPQIDTLQLFVMRVEQES